MYPSILLDACHDVFSVSGNALDGTTASWAAYPITAGADLIPRILRYRSRWRGGLAGIYHWSNARPVGCTKSKHNPGVSVDAMAPLGVHSNRQRASMGNMAISRFAASTNSIVWLYNNRSMLVSFHSQIMAHITIRLLAVLFSGWWSRSSYSCGAQEHWHDIGLLDFAP